MDNLINWFEIPATDFKRAINFYNSILNVKINEVEMMGSQMGFLPTDGKNVSGAIMKGTDYQPSTIGSLLYLNGGKDLNGILSKVKGAGGSVLVSKTAISPEMGFFALFTDSEGNKIALHSFN